MKVMHLNVFALTDENDECIRNLPCFFKIKKALIYILLWSSHTCFKVTVTLQAVIKKLCLPRPFVKIYQTRLYIIRCRIKRRIS